MLGAPLGMPLGAPVRITLGELVGAAGGARLNVGNTLGELLGVAVGLPLGIVEDDEVGELKLGIAKSAIVRVSVGATFAVNEGASIGSPHGSGNEAQKFGKRVQSTLAAFSTITAGGDVERAPDGDLEGAPEGEDEGVADGVA